MKTPQLIKLRIKLLIILPFLYLSGLFSQTKSSRHKRRYEYQSYHRFFFTLMTDAFKTGSVRREKYYKPKKVYRPTLDVE